jgi:competence protein ComGC
MKVKIKGSRGITLIALIVTIIVLLILSGITISMLTGKNGILGKAAEAKLYGERSSLLEALRLKISEYMIDGVRTNEEAIKKLKEEGYINEDNTININKTAVQSMSTGKGSLDTGDVYVLEQRQKVAATSSENVALDYYLVYYDRENNDIEIGRVFGFANGENKVNLAEILEDFTKNPDKYIAEGQSPTNGDRAIGTDGKAVNMDLWNTTIIDESNKKIGLYTANGSSYSPAYENDNIKDGKIQGTIPQYIKVDGKEGVYTVTEMNYAFADCTNLATAPEIPSSVTNMNYTFRGCTSLKTASEIPSSVTDLQATFYNCKSLTTAPKISNSVTNMRRTFEGCTSLATAPEIPNSVTDMTSTFYNCTSLTGLVKIKSDSIDMAYGCFGEVTNNIKVQVPKASTTYTTFDDHYGTSPNITIEQY